MYDAEMWKHQEADQKYVESFEICCKRKMEEISWTNHVRNEELLQSAKEERNILHTMKRRKVN